MSAERCNCGTHTKAACDFAGSCGQAAPALSERAPSEAKTDLSKQLRDIAAPHDMGSYVQVRPQMLIAAATEIERYYGGMMAWKKTAEAKDREVEAPSAGSVDTPEFCDLITELDAGHEEVNHERSKKAWAALIAHIDSLLSAARKAAPGWLTEADGQLLHEAVTALEKAGHSRLAGLLKMTAKRAPVGEQL